MREWAGRMTWDDGMSESRDPTEVSREEGGGGGDPLQDCECDGGLVLVRWAEEKMDG